MKTLNPRDVRRALVQVTRDTWSTFLDVRADPMPTVVRQISNYRLESMVNFEGPWSGALSLVSGPCNATQWASTMFGVEADHCCDEDVLDAAGELANVLAGGVKSILPKGTTLTPPQVKMRPASAQPGAKSIISAVEFGDAPMSFVVALLGPNGRQANQTQEFSVLRNTQ